MNGNEDLKKGDRVSFELNNESYEGNILAVSNAGAATILVGSEEKCVPLADITLLESAETDETAADKAVDETADEAVDEAVDEAADEPDKQTIEATDVDAEDARILDNSE